MTNDITTPKDGYRMIDEIFDPETRIPDVSFVIRSNEEIAVLLRKDTFDKLLREGEQTDWDVIQRLRYRNRHRDIDEVERDIDEAIEEVRRERMDERRKSA